MSNILQVLANSILMLCILSSLTASWFETFALNRRAKDFHGEIQRSIQDEKAIDPVYVNKPLAFHVAEVVAIVSFVASLLLFLIG
ncbi:MAG: hypothetical protein RBU23_12765 [Candidatus Auribacterota bacterium]|jgi:hypothetical protein|nr:hypothetical protein [Candidatus Auribacterota bacterium]